MLCMYEYYELYTLVSKWTLCKLFTFDSCQLQFQQFVIGDFQTALDLDSLLSSHPVEAPVSDPDEINSQFDDISYDKVCFY